MYVIDVCIPIFFFWGKFMKLLFRSVLLFIFASSYLFSFQASNEDLNYKRHSKESRVQHSSQETHVNEFVKHNSQVSINSISATANIVADVTDSLTLVAIYNAMGGEEFWTIKTNWLTDAPLNTWYGITLNEDGKVSEILLDENNITSTIPTELGNLTELVYLSLWDNKLSGSIPKELGNLSKLKELYLGFNQLTSGIPAELFQLDELETLNLRNNFLSGPIPSEHGTLGSLKNILLDNNQLSGTIPKELGSITNLEILSIANNELTGSIPPELGSLANLDGMSLSENRLTGELPKELGNLSNITEFNSFDNQLSGSIPKELGNLSKLTILTLHLNQLTGPIPAELGSMTELVELHLWGNNLNGSVPKELGKLERISYIYLYDNELSGSIPKELGNPIYLQELRLDKNQLSGSIPKELGDLGFLDILNVQNNHLEGELPESFLKLKSLTRLSLFDNQLDGGLENLPSHQMLEIRLENNKFDFADFNKVNIKSVSYLYEPQDSLGEQEIIILEGGEEYTLSSATEHVDGNIYKWFKDGQEIQEQTSTHLTITDAQIADYGVYTCTVTNEIAPLLTLYRATVSLTSGNTASVNPFVKITNEFNVYPNPARDFVTIEFSNSESKGSIQILDLLGSEVMSLDISNETLVNIDVSKFANGYYNIVINSGDKNYFQPLFVNR